MLVHPQFDPIAFSLGPLAVRWYGLMYVTGFIAFITLGKLRVRQGLSYGITARDVDDLILATPTDVFVVPGEAVDFSVTAYARRSRTAKLLGRPLRSYRSFVSEIAAAT